MYTDQVSIVKIKTTKKYKNNDYLLIKSKYHLISTENIIVNLL